MKIYKLFIVLIILYLSSSCNDSFMDRYPEALNDNTFWNTTEDLKTYANRFYSYFPSGLDFRIDNSSDNQAPNDRPEFFWNEYPVPSSSDTWNYSSWEFIRHANYFLTHYQNVTGIESEINKYVAEVRFFRAAYYADKVNQFGDLPWLDKELNVNDTEILYGPKLKRDQVVDKILEDFDYAIQWLPDNPESGRISKNVARHLKARICLHEGTYYKYHTELGINSSKIESLLNMAADAAKDVMNSGKHQIYSTGNPESDYYNLFLIEDKTSLPEAILPVIYLKDTRQHNSTREVSEAATGFSKDFVKSYLCTDGHPIGLSTLYQGDKTTFMAEAANRDPRFKQTILTPEFPWRIANDGSVTYRTEDEMITNFCRTGYNLIKYYSNQEIHIQANSNVFDGIMYRYAETLLIYAEAKAELKTITQNDLDISINLLRNRVGMPHLSIDVGFTDPDWPNWKYDLSPLLQEIRRERRIELAAEGFRFKDLLRWKAGHLADNRETYTGIWIPEENRYAEVYSSDRTRKWNDRLYLYPIPTGQILLNPQLGPQNPGWE